MGPFKETKGVEGFLDWVGRGLTIGGEEAFSERLERS